MKIILWTLLTFSVFESVLGKTINFDDVGGIANDDSETTEWANGALLNTTLS